MPQTPKPDRAKQPHTDDEPEMAQEEDIPSDGKDPKGEQMMQELGRNKPGPQLSEDPPSGTKE